MECFQQGRRTAEIARMPRGKLRGKNSWDIHDSRRGKGRGIVDAMAKKHRTSQNGAKLM